MPTANRSSSKRSRVAPTLEGLVEELAALGSTDHWVVSCYLKLEPRDRARSKYLIKLKNRIRDCLDSLEARGVDRADRQVVARDLERIREHLDDPGALPAGRGIAVFACEPLDLFQSVPLARVFRSRLVVDRSPLVREMAALSDEFGRVLCAVSDRASARFFEVTAREARELPSLPAGETTRPSRFHAIGGSALGEHNFNQRIREEKHRHYANVAQRLFELTRNGPVRGIVLAGTGTDVEAVRPHLHPYIQAEVLGTAKLNPKTVTLAEVVDAVFEVRAATERRWEVRHAAELEEGLGTRWAVNGALATLDALYRGQVRVLLVDGAATVPGFRCADSGRLALDADGCDDVEGHAVPVADLIDEALEEALRQGSHVDVVEDDAVRGRVDRLAALLRFTLP